MNNHLVSILYKVLFEHPLFSYCDAKKSFNILIADDDKHIQDVVQTIWYCAQMPKRFSFHFHLYKTGDETVKKLNAFFANVKDLIDPPSIESFDSDNAGLVAYVKAHEINYILSSNKSIYDEIIKLKENMTQPIFACTIDAGYAGVTIEIDQHKVEQNFKGTDLLRLARNIDFAYTLSYSDTAPRKSLDEFAAQRESDDPEKQTSYDSSLAAAVHIPYKLYIAQTNDIQNIKTDILYQLYHLEHTRWMAYSYCRGWHMPTDEEIINYAFKGGKNHKHNQEKLHPCMCHRGTAACQLQLPPYNQLWDKIDTKCLISRNDIRQYVNSLYPENNLSDLDIASLQIHGLACKQANECDLESIKNNLTNLINAASDYEKAILQELEKRFEDLTNKTERAVSLYQQCIKDAAIILGENSPLLKAFIEAAEPYIIANKKCDYEAIDNDLIDMLPFILNYGNSFQTAIVISKGEPFEDLIIPTLLIPEKAIFIVSEKLSEHQQKKYQSIIRKYFSGRGNKTKPVFKTVSSYNSETISNIVCLCCNENNPTPFIVNNSVFPEVPYGINQANSDPASKIPVMYFSDENNQIRIIGNATQNRVVGGITNLVKNGYTTEEFISLSGGEIRNYIYKSSLSLSPNEHQILKNILYHYTEQSGNDKFMWNAISEIFQKELKSNRKYYKVSKDSKEEQEYNIICDTSLKEELYLLDDFRVIRINKTVSDSHGITFSCKNDGIFSAISDCREKNYRFEFVPHSGKITGIPVTLSDNAFTDQIDYLDDLHKSGLIQYKDKKITPKMPELLMTEGKALEIVLYYRLKNTGLFSDIQTNIELSWRALYTSFDERMKKKLNQDSDNWGYDYFWQCLEDAKNNLNDSADKILDITNEIDLIAIDKKFTPIIISCKNRKKLDKAWIYELVSLSNHFNSKGILAINRSKEHLTDDFKAKAMLNNISLLTREDIFEENDSVFAEKIKKIIL